ncbi:MAG: cardiolipin synthase [Acidobacteriota bacterium]|nr:cardiolipin synthase [Acidobacteriota bacterium]
MRKTFDWHIPVIGVLGLLLWNTNRRRTKPKFEMSGEADLKAMIPTLVGISEGSVDHGNAIEILQNGEFFDRLLDDIARARQSIHIESYIWWTGAICEQLADALIQRVRDGVEVRVLLDYSGSQKMDSKLKSRMKDGGCALHQFRPLRFTNIGRMNLRTHRKIAVIDGRIGYVGGHGIAEQWTGNAQDKDHWRDTAIRAEGPVVTTLQGVFCENWIEETDEVPAGEKYFPKLEECGKVDAHVAYAEPRGSISSVQLLYYLAINAARKELLIQNPYFLPHEDAIDSLMQAVRRGVDVRIMLPSASIIDSALVQHASHHHYGDMLKNGIRIFEHQKTLTHQKIMIVDKMWSCVGSTNFDDRSFELNDEITVGMINRGIAKKLRDAFHRDLLDCKEIEFDAWRTRPWRHRLIDGGCYLLRGEL